jgi:hypothetical protein
VQLAVIAAADSVKAGFAINRNLLTADGLA